MLYVTDVISDVVLVANEVDEPASRTVAMVVSVANEDHVGCIAGLDELVADVR